MNGATTDATPPSHEPEPGQRWPRRWRSLTALMILIGLIALGLSVYDYLHRIEVVITNRSGKPIEVARIEHDGRTVAVGSIRPGWQTAKRIRSPMSGSITVDIMSRGAGGQLVRRDNLSLGGVSMRWTTQTCVQFVLRDDGAHFGILQR